jgi:8-oxo-dGTP diphosphatase
MAPVVERADGSRFAWRWRGWQPREVAVLCFVRRGHEILLIRKRRGLGAGKVNGPGGRVEPGETPAQAAVRETAEEVCVRPDEVRSAGVLFFAFADGYSLRCHVFTGSADGQTPQTTDEAIPFWVRAAAIPYDEMWADDRVWFPAMLAGKPFAGWFAFEGDRLLWHRLKVGRRSGPQSQDPAEERSSARGGRDW